MRITHARLPKEKPERLLGGFHTTGQQLWGVSLGQKERDNDSLWGGNFEGPTNSLCPSDKNSHKGFSLSLCPPLQLRTRRPRTLLCPSMTRASAHASTHSPLFLPAFLFIFLAPSLALPSVAASTTTSARTPDAGCQGGLWRASNARCGMLTIDLLGRDGGREESKKEGGLFFFF